MLFVLHSYSWDEGESWHNFKFSSVKVRVYGLLTEPGEKTTIFTLFGSYATRHSWFTVQVNMMDVLGSKFNFFFLSFQRASEIRMKKD